MTDPFLDADNDGFEDLYVSGSLDGSNDGFLPSAFYHNQGNETFTIPSNIGFANDTRESYSNAIGDINNDGKPDIVVSNDTDHNFLWKNTTVNSNNWLKIKLAGVNGNKDGIGNKIEIHANGQSQYRYTACGEGYLGQNSSYKFVGIGNAAIIDYIKVTWNHSGQVETLYNITPNQAITIREGSGVLGTPDVASSDFTVFPNPGSEGIFAIRFNEEFSKKHIQIFDISGRLLFSFEKNTQSVRMDLSSYAKGVYFVKITSHTNLYKVVKLIHR
ncbi:MAG: T9SS type A sorting domain-containing protein [Flavobacteriaceae bacterium]|nr:MAG: T9SS type A sorting domain-containing protein [Flavobacteriaceae bacterium]